MASLYMEYIWNRGTDVCISKNEFEMNSNFPMWEPFLRRGSKPIFFSLGEKLTKSDGENILAAKPFILKECQVFMEYKNTPKKDKPPLLWNIVS